VREVVRGETDSRFCESYERAPQARVCRGDRLPSARVTQFKLEIVNFLSCSMASQAPSDLLTVEQATILPQLDPFQQFTAAYKNIPKSGRLLGTLQVIQGQSRYEDDYDDYDPQAFLLERKGDAEIYSALSDLIKTNFCCGGEISVRPIMSFSPHHDNPGLPQRFEARIPQS
jgi:hypothetical protein